MIDVVVTEYQLPTNRVEAPLSLHTGAQILGVRPDMTSTAMPQLIGNTITFPAPSPSSFAWLIVAQPPFSHDGLISRTFICLPTGTRFDADRFRYIGSCITAYPVHVFEIMKTSRAEWEEAGRELVEIARQTEPN